jgi:hypothetical protein
MFIPNPSSTSPSSYRTSRRRAAAVCAAEAAGEAEEETAEIRPEYHTPRPWKFASHRSPTEKVSVSLATPGGWDIGRWKCRN